MSEKQILPNVEPMVLAENYPKIAAVFPHVCDPRSDHEVGWTGRLSSGPDDVKKIEHSVIP